MKYNSVKRSLLSVGNLAIAASLLLGSCTKNFESYNTDPYGLTNADLSIDYKLLGTPLQQAQMGIYSIVNPAWDFQVQQNLNADLYSNYMATPTPFDGGSNNSTYTMVSGWNSQAWADAYGFVMSQVKSVFTNGQAYPDFIAWARIIRVEAMHRISDIYGPIIYTHYGTVNADGSVTYDSQKDAYYAFFNDLDSAITVLTPLAQSGAKSGFTDFDYSYGGSYTEWVKFANTLRLRLALRIVNIDPAKAQTEGELALANPIGILTDNTDNYNVSTGTQSHPLNVINNSWGDIRFGATLGSFLNGYKDARAPKYALPATDPAVAGQIIGVRTGINIDDKSRYEGYSQMVTFSNSIQLMTSAEAWFLKAEAALRGWAGAGNAGANYNKGILTSFSQYGLDGTSYMNDATDLPQAYTDPKSIVAGANNVTSAPELSTITIQWDAAATFAQQLERIITQKYIAMYPEGQEAWSEYRRTGYPKLWPNVVNTSSGLIPSAKGIRRLPFSIDEVNSNPAGVAGAVTLLGGPDTGGTPLWWDVR